MRLHDSSPVSTAPVRMTSTLIGQQSDAAVLEAVRRLIARDLYPTAKLVAPIAGVHQHTVWRSIRRMRRKGQFPELLPKKSHQKQWDHTDLRITRAYQAILDDGRTPTVRRIMDLLGLSRTAVGVHLKRLQAAGSLAQVPPHVLEADQALINRVRDRNLYQTILKVHSIDCAKNPHHPRMTYSLIADTVSQLLGRNVTDDQVRRYLNVTGYRRRPCKSNAGHRG